MKLGQWLLSYRTGQLPFSEQHLNKNIFAFADREVQINLQ